MRLSSVAGFSLSPVPLRSTLQRIILVTQRAAVTALGGNSLRRNCLPVITHSTGWPRKVSQYQESLKPY